MVYPSSEGVSKEGSGRCHPEGACGECQAGNGFRRVLEATDDASKGDGLAKGLSKAEARSGVRRLQQFFGLAFLLSAISGVYLLATDGSLWLLAISHAVGLVVIVVIDVVLAVLNLRLRRKIYLPSLAAALLGFMLQLADILTAPQYNMTMRYFASYLFGLWAFDLLLVLQFAIISIGVAGRGYARELARRQKTKRARELGYSRRGFLQAIASFAGIDRRRCGPRLDQAAPSQPAIVTIFADHSGCAGWTERSARPLPAIRQADRRNSKYEQPSGRLPCVLRVPQGISEHAAEEG